MARPPLFPDLGADAPLAAGRLWQTLALGLVPLGVALLLAVRAPAPPLPAIYAVATLIPGAMALLWILWRRAGRRLLRGYSTCHFLVRYVFFATGPVLLWLGFGDLILELVGGLPPLMLGLWLAIHPAGRILRGRAGTDPRAAPRIELAHIVCLQLEMVLGVLAVAGLLSGAILEANRGYPTDPAPLLILIWLLALLAVLVGVGAGYAHWVRLFGRREVPQTLDDPPPAGAATPASRFGAERF